MKEMIKRMREEKGGFTLAELLIVVAIVMVLVAIAVPVFIGAQDSAKTATHDANLRAAKSAAMVYALEENIDIGTNKAIEAKGTINEKGDIAITAVAGVANVGTDTLSEEADGVDEKTLTTGNFKVYLKPTEVPAPTPDTPPTS